MKTATTTITQVNEVYIRATAQAIWDAITQPDWTERYGYACRSDYDLRPGGEFHSVAGPEMQAMGMPEQVVDGEVIESDPPRRLVQTWRFLWSDEIKAEGPKRLTYEITESIPGVCKLTITHELDNAPLTEEMVSGRIPNAGGGWAYVLSDLKSLLETGQALGS
jgi:uncharacterized protein YndB with AHSA1/START domain